MKQRPIFTGTFVWFIVFALTAQTAVGAPLYETSVVGTDFDFITETDPNTFMCLEYEGFKQYEMPDKRYEGGELFQDAYIFNAYFSDGSKVDIALSKGFGSKDAALKDAMRYTSRIGKLPTLYRSQLDHIVVHKGGEDTTAFADNGFFVIYSDNATKRISTHDLEETFFHESTHATIQDDYNDASTWTSAQTKDDDFITEYAQNDKEGEDMAESALFAYTLIHHPDRFPVSDKSKIENTIPNRIAFFKVLFPVNKPVMYSLGDKHICSKDAVLSTTVPYVVTATTVSNVTTPTTNEAKTSKEAVYGSLIESVKQILVQIIALMSANK